MPTPTVADMLKYANLQMAAEALYRFKAKTNAELLVPGDHFTGAIDVATTGDRPRFVHAGLTKTAGRPQFFA